MRRRRRTVVVVLCGLTLAAGATLVVERSFGQPVGEGNERISHVVSPPPPRGPTTPSWGNGESTNIVFSQDNREVRLFAFESAATNMTSGDTNGRRDVFVVRRDGGPGNHSGEVTRASVGPRGQQANGDSFSPSLDGSTRARPHCVAFESRATNLDSRDRDRDLDVYVHDLRTRRTRLLSVGRRGARRAVVDGQCRSVTFESAGRVWVADVGRQRILLLAAGRDPDQQTNGRGVVYIRGGQVYHRTFILRRGRLRRGRERLVSDNRHGQPGNGRSGNPVADDQGHYVAFDSTSTDLCAQRCAGVSRDRNGRVSDVYRRTLTRRAPTRDSMQMVSYSHSVRAQGNSPSFNPAMSGAGENIVFESQATNLRQRAPQARRDMNGPVSDIYSWTFPRRRGYGNVSLEGTAICPSGAVDCDASSTRPSMSSRGNYIGYTSRTTDFCDPRRPPAFSPRSCPSFTDVFARWMGASHEGHPTG